MVKRVLITIFIALLLLVAGCLIYLFLPPFPQATWDMPPDEKVVEVSYIGEIDYNYIPDVQIWGDGHIVWVQHDGSGKRRVQEGYLSKEEMTRLINRFIEVGFFRGYSRLRLDIQSGDIVTIYLPNIQHRVAINTYPVYKNQQVLDLVSFLRDGAGVTGAEFIPKSGTLLVFPIEELDENEYPQNSQADYEWPDEKFGYSLETVCRNSNVREITGKELDFAWAVVNSPRPLVESKGKVYWIAVIIPKINL